MGLTNFMSVFFMIIFSAALLISGNNAQITDTDGDLLLNGGRYFIRPQDISVNGGLTITPPPQCPYYITRSKDETFPGIPVTISSPFKIAFISPGLPISISFDPIMIPSCSQSSTWQVIKSYVRTGGTDSSPDFSIYFGRAGSYIINYIKENGGVVGLFDKDGLLGVNNYTPLFVSFVKVPAFNNNAIAMKV